MSRTGFLFVASRQLDARLTAVETFLTDRLGYTPPEITGACLFPFEGDRQAPVQPKAEHSEPDFLELKEAG